ncbi:hypothetical protein FRB94_008579 [Tulasnella sp. JGI-2019a]|nr:hypothetical protein FRB94_008579 [Tulasnella sp. JGI-2019a]
MLLSSAILAIGVLPFVSFVKAFPSFAGTNLYYAAGLSASQRATYFAGLQSADMKVLRVWLDGQSTATTKNTPITSYPDLETTVGVYNDTVLDLLDAVMLDAKNYGIKLLISMHSWNALSRPDIYGETYGVENFYIWQNATEAFDNRMRHVMNHVHSTLHVPWKHLSDYIFAFEAENEMAIGNGQDFIVAHSDWQCGRAQVIKAELAGAQILVTTGGESWLDESINDTLLNCTHLDVVAVHAYGVGDLNTTKIQPYVTSALQNGKKLLFQEWGACYYNTSNNTLPFLKVRGTRTFLNLRATSALLKYHGCTGRFFRTPIRITVMTTRLDLLIYHSKRWLQQPRPRLTMILPSTSPLTYCSLKR